MAKLTGRQIRDLGKAIVEQTLGGIRYSELVTRIAEMHPETPRNTITGSIWDLDRHFPDLIHKPSRGLFSWIPNAQSPESQPTAESGSPAEEQFYASFADWLTNELDEVTVAIPLGGAGLRGKWGTPDVLGVYKPLPSHRIKFDIEIVSAEIKVSPNQPVVAFGQAAAYRLFSAKSYVAMPQTMSADDYGRLEALCMLFGIGLVLFEPNVDAPNFSIRVRAQRYSPDMFYVNEFAERLYQIDPNKFDRLFGY